MSETGEDVETGLPVEQPNANDEEQPTEEQQEEAAPTDEKPKLNMKNWLNLLFFVINIVFTYGIGTVGWLGNGNNSELSRKYQTLVTPNSTAFVIWAVIFIFQGLFTILQLLPRFRAKPMVQQGVGYWYLLVCTFQVAWTFAFAYEVIWLSLLFMLLIWVSLCSLLYSQYYTESDGTLVEFWFFRFPFSIHCGWITAASVLNVNVVVVNAKAPADVQLAVAIVSLAYLHAVSVWVLFGLKRNPNYTIAGVLSWAFGWIYNELQNPDEKIVALFDEDIISGVSYAAIAVSIIVAGQMVVRFGMYLVQRYLVSRGGDSEEEAEQQNTSKENETSEKQDLVDAKV